MIRNNTDKYKSTFSLGEGSAAISHPPSDAFEKGSKKLFLLNLSKRE